jgi:hypothetical protein
MIIKDNFIKDVALLEDLRKEAKAFSTGYADGIKDTFWKNFNAEAVNTSEKVCQIIFDRFCETSEYQGFEYWVNYLLPCEGNALEWHSDKDEYLAKTAGRFVCPTLGMVLYLHEEDPEGGYLEISTEAEHIEAPPNRFILFNPSAPHRVTPTKKPRLTLAANVWRTAPSKENFSGKKLIRKKS